MSPPSQIKYATPDTPSKIGLRRECRQMPNTEELLNIKLTKTATGGVSIKKLFLKIHRKTPVLESLFNKVVCI